MLTLTHLEPRHVPVVYGAGGAIYDNDAIISHPFGDAYRGTVHIAVTSDINADGVNDIVAGAGQGGGPRVTVVSGADGETLATWFAFEPSFRGGVYVGSDGDAIYVGAGPSGGPVVVAYDAATLTERGRRLVGPADNRDGVTITSAPEAVTLTVDRPVPYPVEVEVPIPVVETVRVGVPYPVEVEVPIPVVETVRVGVPYEVSALNVAVYVTDATETELRNFYDYYKSLPKIFELSSRYASIRWHLVEDTLGSGNADIYGNIGLDRFVWSDPSRSGTMVHEWAHVMDTFHAGRSGRYVFSDAAEWIAIWQATAWPREHDRLNPHEGFAQAMSQYLTGLAPVPNPDLIVPYLEKCLRYIINLARVTVGVISLPMPNTLVGDVYYPDNYVPTWPVHEYLNDPLH